MVVTPGDADAIPTGALGLVKGIISTLDDGRGLGLTQQRSGDAEAGRDGDRGDTGIDLHRHQGLSQ
jgi:hypothetical protein